MADALVEQLGLLGVFLAGATPWLEAVVVIPVAIALGLPPVWTIVAGLVGNTVTIVVFAVLSEKITAAIAARRARAGKSPTDQPRRDRARRIFLRYGVFGMAVLGPLVIGTQIAAAWAVPFGVSALRASVIVTVGAVVWGVLTGLSAWALVN